MIKNSKTKMITTAPAEKAEKRDYHFAGSGKYRPITISAASQEEAMKIWLVQRVPEALEAPKAEPVPEKKEE